MIRYCILTTIPQGSVQLHTVREVEGRSRSVLTSPQWLANFNTLPAAMAYCREAYRERGESLGWEHDAERGRYLSTPSLTVGDAS